ncbi:MAG: RNA polymerase factor sigma-54 [Verrucomicrobia bacterium]|nr:RNA polymerase factor sigma-54 [Verrucomicrobiota bacterium]
MAGMQQVAKMALQQSLSPQMQQSLNILQAPLTELRQLVDTELRANPALEEVAPEKPVLNEEAPASNLEDQWNEYYSQRATAEPWTREALERRQHFLDSQVRPPTLTEHLLEQLHTASWPREEATIAAEIIGNLDDGGYLRASIEEIAANLEVPATDVETILGKVQEFDPAGVAARTLSECLLLQLKAQGRQYSTEMRIVRHYLDELGRKKLSEIAKALDLEIPEIQRAAEVIAHLDPAPGRTFAPDSNQIVTPEVVVEYDGEDYTVSLNSDEVPRLRISDSYKDMLAGNSKEVRDYLRDKIRTGNFFIKSIQQRQQTIMNIAREIVVRQREFMERGPTHLKPMTMGQVADAVGVHETTVSRAAAGKFMLTPQGIFEMKYFFTHGYTNSDGEGVSNESVRQAIAQIVKEENPKIPHSDQDIVTMLSGRGIKVARRTVAKYREQLGILPSHLRKGF